MSAHALDNFHAKTFIEQLHTKFQVHAPGAAPVEMELVEVVEPPGAPNVEQFAVHFRGPAAPRLNQQIYRVEHDKLGRFELFLVAVAGDPQSITYEAVFHRLRKNA